MTSRLHPKVTSLLFLLLMYLPLTAVQAQTFPFRLPNGSGTFRLGAVCGDESCWFDACDITRNQQTYHIKHRLWADGEIQLTIHNLTDTQGFIVEVTGTRLPDNLRLSWAFGGCDPSTDAATLPDHVIPVGACHDNVASVEGTAFTVYYGEVMKLRVVHGLTPDGSEIRLADGHRQESPLTLFHSGKKTDAPVLSAITTWDQREKLYFCFYKQNAKADYNYFMLPALFLKEHNQSTH